MVALPSLHLIERGSFPGYEFGVWSVRDVRLGEAKRTFSPGRGTKLLVLVSSMTQLIDILGDVVPCWKCNKKLGLARMTACCRSLGALTSESRRGCHDNPR